MGEPPVLSEFNEKEKRRSSVTIATLPVPRRHTRSLVAMRDRTKLHGRRRTGAATQLSLPNVVGTVRFQS